MILIGVWYLVASGSDGAVRLGLGLDRWAGPVYGIGGAALMFEGLALQLDPSSFLRKRRLQQGEGSLVTATVVRAVDLGSLKGRAKVQVELKMDVNGRVERHSAKTAIDRALLARIEGGTVDVVVDPADPTLFDVKWETLRP